LKEFQEEVDAERKAWEIQACPMPKSVSKKALASTESPVLFGLRILNQRASSTMHTSNTSVGSENIAPQVTTPPNQRRKSAAYEPHSTIRARKRASFDEQRALHEIEREEEEERIRQVAIKQRRAELIKLRENLR
jgi:hypothetical protein